MNAVENVLSLRELRFPPDNCGQTPVVCGRSQFPITKYVPNPALRTTTRIIMGEHERGDSRGDGHARTDGDERTGRRCGAARPLERQAMGPTAQARPRR